MIKIHRAIRPAYDEGTYFMYDITYSGDGVEMFVENLNIHLVDLDGNIGPDVLFSELKNTPTVLLAAASLLLVDGVFNADDTEVDGLSSQEEIN